MSDEYTIEEKLEGARRSLLKNSIFFGIGWVVFMIGLLNAHGVGMWILAIGWGIIGGKRIIKGIFGGLGAALKPDYEVVTYQNGVRVSSDGGSQSMINNFVVTLFVAGFLFLIGGFISMVHMIILSVRYIVLHLQSSPKPAFVKSGMFIIVMNIAVLIGGFAIGAITQHAVWNISLTAAGAKTSGDYRYYLTDAKDGVILDEYFGKKGGAIVIPATIDGLPVLEIQASLLFTESGKPPYGTKDNRKERITSVVFPDTVTTINGGFKSCSELTQITLPKNLKKLGNAFWGTGITSIVIPKGVTEMISTFTDCKNLTSIVIPEGVKNIGNGTFSGCSSLTTVTLPRSLENIGKSAFKNCTSLVDVIIPPGTNIEYSGSDLSDYSKYNEYSFYNCPNLSNESQQAIRDTGYTWSF